MWVPPAHKWGFSIWARIDNRCFLTTMTKYQRGELMEGWNDCPPPMGSRDSSSASVGSVRSKRRPARPPAGSDSARAPPTGPARTVPPMLVPPTSGPRPPAAVAAAPENRSEPSDIDLGATPALLRQILADSGLEEKHQTVFVKRVVEAYPQLGAQHQKFVSEVAVQLSRQQDSSSIKSDILKYMMVHSGVSTWCVPLKKLVESVGQ